MKKIKLALLATLTLLTGVNAFAAWETEGQGSLKNNTWYALYDTNEYHDGDNTWGGFDWGPQSKTFTLNAPGDKVSLQAKLSSKASTGKSVIVYEGDKSKSIGNSSSVSTSYQTYGPYSMTAGNEYTKVCCELSGNFGRYIKNIFVTQATYLYILTSSPNTLECTVGETATTKITIKYSNGTFDKDLTISSDNNLFTTDVTKIEDGYYGEKQVTITFEPAQFGSFEGNITIGGNGAQEQIITIKGICRPATPVAKPASKISTSSFQANWETINDEATYTVIVKNNNDTIAIKNVEAQTSSVVIDSLNPVTDYTYTVTAHDKDMDSAPSEVIEVTTNSKSNVTFNAYASAEKNIAVVKWNIIADGDFEIDSIIVECGEIREKIIDGETSYTFTGLDNSKDYTINVTAVINEETFKKTLNVSTKSEYYGEQLPNFDFELWEKNTEEKAEPIGWNSFETAKTTTLTSFGVHQAMDKSTSVTRPATKGNSSVYIWTANIAGVDANGNMTTGKINMGSATATSAKNYNFTDTSNSNHRAAFGSVPDSLTVWVKFESGDKTKGPAGVSAYIHGDVNFQDPINETYKNDVVATANGNISAESKEWVRISVPFAKSSTEVTPKYILCSFKTNNKAGVGTDGEKLYIDDALMIYKPNLNVNTLEKTSFEPENIIVLPFSIEGTMSPYNLNAKANIAYLELSDASGSFDYAIALDSLTTDFGGTFTGKLPADLGGGNYKIRVRTTNYPMISETQDITVISEKLSAPTATNATEIGKNTFTANWTAIEGATGYYLTVLDAIGEVVEDYNRKDVENVLTETVTINDYTDGGTYTYSVIAYNETQKSNSSNTIEVKLISTVIIAPDATEATEIGKDAFVANWETTENTTGYYLTVLDKDDIAVEGYDKKDIGNVLKDSVVIANYENGGTYKYFVIAYNSIAESNHSDTVSVTLIPVITDIPVVNEATEVGKDAFVATWGSVENADGYYLTVLDKDDIAVEGYDKKDVGNVLRDSIVIANYENGGTYKYFVIAYNSVSESEPSDTLSVTLIPAITDVPVVKEATNVSKDAFVANWEATENAEGYYLTILDKDDNVIEGFDKKDIGNVLKDSVVLADYENGGTYKYFIIAYNSVSESEPSDSISVTLTPTAIIYTKAETLNLVVYPNPVDDILYINAEDAIAQIAIYTTNGSLALVQDENNESVNVSDLANGTYFINATSTNGKLYQTVFVKK